MTRLLPPRTSPFRPLLEVLVAVVIFGSLLFVTVKAVTAPEGAAPEGATYCADVASARAPRCPPEPGSVVLGVWPTGAVASVEWTGSDWRLRVPGGGRVRVAAPPDWREP